MKEKLDVLISSIVKKSKPTPDKTLPQIRDAFLSAYKKEFGHDYPGWGPKEYGMTKAWLKSVPLTKAIELCELYPKWNDPYVTKLGHPFGLLISGFIQLEAWSKGFNKRVDKIAEGKAIETNEIKRAIERKDLERGSVYYRELDRKLPRPIQRQVPSSTEKGIPKELERDPSQAFLESFGEENA